LPARFDRAFTALPGGAALALGGCEDRPALPGEDCTVWCSRGCPPTPDPVTNQSYDAFWVSSDGVVTKLDFPLSAPRPILVPGSDGRPWLIASGVDQAGQPVPDDFAAYRFDPWQHRFDAVDLDLGFSPAMNQARVVSTGPDAFIWLDADSDGPVVRGVRLGTRSAFSSDVPLVKVHDDSARPAHLAPDHPPDGTVSYEGNALQFSELASQSAPTCVWISDAEYGDFSAKIQFSSEIPPALRLGARTIAAPNSTGPSAPCQLPAPGSLTGTTHDIALSRKGARLTLSIGAASSSCDLDDTIAPARVPFGVCQSELGAVTVTQITVTRGG
ncbi:MAG TPA: hypothetical protein VNW92_19005, partial [Polyangiaceae bacterium]|nr:hypothetical protein [Polyangiaceae bacterium]